MTEPKKLGRKPTPIDFEEMEKLCAMQCTLVEIAAFFNCSVDTIERAVKAKENMGFAEYFKAKSALGRMSLRRRMFHSAIEDGSVPMMMWLSKQYLGHSEKSEVISANMHHVSQPALSVDQIKQVTSQDQFTNEPIEAEFEELQREGGTERSETS